MTLCIGALAQIPSPLSPCIVLCFDRKVSTESFSSESEYKHHWLSRQFVALASDRPARAKELADIYRHQLEKVEVTQNNALEVLREPVMILKRNIANSYIARKLGVSYQDFLDHGVAWFGPEAFGKYQSDIENNPLGVEMIIAGFVGNEPCLFELREGELAHSTNFCLVGTGAYTAEPALHARGQRRYTAVSETLYNCYEAKRIAESSPFVGKDTRMLIVHPPDHTSKGHVRAQVVTPEGEKWLRGLFRRYGPKPIKMWPIMPEGVLQKAFFDVTEGY